MIEIKHRHTDVVLFSSSTARDRRGAVVEAAKAGANLFGADLEGADLKGADLAAIRVDVRAVLDTAPNEVPGLLAALREGRIDGSAYVGECACLVGTIANVRGVDVHTLPRDSNRPAERWFLAIASGMAPATSQVVAITEGWIVEWLEDRK